MRVEVALAVAAALLVSRCGGTPPAAPTRSGVAGRVLLGPQCPVESLTSPCPPAPAVQVEVTLTRREAGARPATGAVVARATTDSAGRFLLPVPPGAYVVTADAGMSCDTVPTRVPASAYAWVDVGCDTGVR